MQTQKLRTRLLATALMAATPIGCTLPPGTTVSFEAGMLTPAGYYYVKLAWTTPTSPTQGPTVTNNGDRPVDIVPRDSQGRPLDSNGQPTGEPGTPVTVPPGGTRQLPPGTDPEKTRDVAQKKEDHGQHSPIPGGSHGRSTPQALPTWFVTTFENSLDTRSTRTFEASAASSPEAMTQVTIEERGFDLPTVELVNEVEMTSISSSGTVLRVSFPTEQLHDFNVLVDGALVASSTSGLGGALVRYANGQANGTATIPLALGADHARVLIELIAPDGTTSNSATSW